jgi:hypothetical protein
VKSRANWLTAAEWIKQRLLIYPWVDTQPPFDYLCRVNETMNAAVMNDELKSRLSFIHLSSLIPHLFDERV